MDEVDRAVALVGEPAPGLGDDIDGAVVVLADLVARDERVDDEHVNSAFGQLGLDLLVDRLGDAGAMFGLGGDDAALVAAKVDVQPALDFLRLDLEPFGGGVDAPLGFLGRVFEVVEPDRQRAIVNGDAVELAVAGHRHRLADLDA